MKTLRLLFVSITTFCVVSSSDCFADSIRRTNNWAYRHMMQTYARSYRHSMYTTYPSPFGLWLRGTIDSHLLQPGGPLDKLLEQLLLNAAGDSLDAIQSQDVHVAKELPKPNSTLDTTENRTRQILEKLEQKIPASQIKNGLDPLTGQSATELHSVSEESLTAPVENPRNGDAIELQGVGKPKKTT